MGFSKLDHLTFGHVHFQVLFLLYSPFPSSYIIILKSIMAISKPPPPNL